MGYDVYDSYIDEWPTALKWETSGSRMRATAETESRLEWTTTYDQQLSDLTSRVLDELKTSINGFPNTSDLISAFMDKLNVEWRSDEDELELELTFEEFMGFEKSEGK